MKTQYTLSEIEHAMKKEGIGRSSTRYVLDTLQKPSAEENTEFSIQVKNKPTYGGVKVSPWSKNNVTFEHNGEQCQLHFLENGNLGLSRENNKDCFLEINQDQIMEFLLSKF
jgi:hypothetical protein